jgi:hypothetical protein
MNALILTCVNRKSVEDVWRFCGRKLRQTVLALGVAMNLASFAFAADAAQPGLHTFTDNQGHSLKATIAKVIEPNVYLQRDGSEPFKVKIDILSDEDQIIIRQWVREHSSAKLPELFQISATPDGSAVSATHGFKVLLKNIRTKTLRACAWTTFCSSPPPQPTRPFVKPARFLSVNCRRLAA